MIDVMSDCQECQEDGARPLKKSPATPSLHLHATHPNIQLEEWATIGIGHFTDICITENMIRREHGLPERVSHAGRVRR